MFPAASPVTGATLSHTALHHPPPWGRTMGRRWQPLRHYFGGHGALLLGAMHPEVMEAAQAEVDRGTHYGANHELESSGPSGRPCPKRRATLHLVGHRGDADGAAPRPRLHRQTQLLRFRSRFHGWHDHMTSGQSIWTARPRPASSTAWPERVAGRPERRGGGGAALEQHPRDRRGDHRAHRLLLRQIPDPRIS